MPAMVFETQRAKILQDCQAELEKALRGIELLLHTRKQSLNLRDEICQARILWQQVSND